MDALKAGNPSAGLSESRRLTIETWILAVSSHPLEITIPMPPASSTYISSSEDDPPAARTQPRYAVPPSQSAKSSLKRSRRDSDSSPITPRSRPILSRNNTPFEPSSPRDSTPSRSELSMSSGASDAGSTISIPTTKHRDKIKVKRLVLNAEDPQLELRATLERIQQSKSSAYTHFEAPTVQVKEDGSATHHLFKCKQCGTNVKRQVGVMETAALRSHTNVCKKRTFGEPLHNFGFSGGSRLSEQEVRETWAIWISEHARPYIIVDDNHLPKLLHPDALKHKPCRKTLSADIKRLYEATQEFIKTLLASTTGALHIGLDLFQSASGFDFLGIVLFRVITEERKPITIDRFMLECLSFGSAHTGIALAKSVLSVLRKFQIQDRVWGVVCDNASNNATMMKHLGKSKLRRLNGPLARVFCILHVLNLVAKAVMRPFHLKRQQLNSNEDANTDDEGSEVYFGLDSVEADDAHVDSDDDGTAPSHMLRDEDDSDDGNDEDESDESEAERLLPKLVPGSAEELKFTRSTKVLFKSANLARKLRYTPAARAAFKSACVQTQVKTPHNVRRDMKVRWNSTDQMLEDVNRTFDAIIVYQTSTRFTPHSQLLRAEDRETIQHLLAVLTPIRSVSEILSRGGVPMLADVIPHYDALSDRYEKIRADSTFPLYIRHAADRAWRVLSKYYSMTDESELYRLAILLHPSMRRRYLELAKWEPEWIENAVDIAVACWKEHYRPEKGIADGEQDAASTPTSQFAYSSFLDQMFTTSPLTEAQGDASCVLEFVNGPVVVERTAEGRQGPINPLVWWHAQRVAGNEWDGLTQMALDVLSTPASSVDVERAFSFTGSIVTKRRHGLAPYSIQATASLGSYSKANLVKPGSLVLPRKGKKAGDD